MSNILCLATTLPAESGDGTPEFVLDLARAMTWADTTIVAPMVSGAPSDSHVDSAVITRFRYAPRRFEVLADDAILPTLRKRPILLAAAPGLVAAFIRAAFTHARREKPDVVHAHWILPGGLVAAVVQSATGTPYIVTAHGADVHALNGRAAKSLKRMIIRRAVGVHAVSQDIADRLEELVPGSVSLVAPMGVATDELDALVGDRLPTPNSLLFVGRLAEKKGVDVLLRAVSALPGVQLRIVGDGPDRPDLERLSEELGLTNRVVFLGKRQRRDVAAEYRTAAALVVPSRIAGNGDTDGTPVVLLEAMASGVPVIASAVGGISEVLTDGETGRLVEPEQVDALQAAISDALTNYPESLKRAAAARRLAQESFTTEALSRKIQTLVATAT